MTSNRIEFVVVLAAASLSIAACSTPAHPLEGSWNCTSAGDGFQFASDTSDLTFGVYEDGTDFVLEAREGEWSAASIPSESSDGVIEWKGAYDVAGSTLTLRIDESGSYEGIVPSNSFVLDGIPEDGRGPANITNDDNQRAFVSHDEGFKIVSSEDNYIGCSRA